MLKKFLVLFLVALLIAPSAVFASDGSDYAAGKHKGNAYGKSHSKDKAKGHEKKEGKKAKKAKKVKKAHKKSDIDDTEKQSGGGILTAIRNIERNIALAGGKAPTALKTVVNKFASLFGLNPVYDIDDQDNTGMTSSGDNAKASYEDADEDAADVDAENAEDIDADEDTSDASIDKEADDNDVDEGITNDNEAEDSDEDLSANSSKGTHEDVENDEDAAGDNDED
ncbi:MAG TPA: hypothetical protein VE439_04540 [Anaerolineae bacterium]|jgi:hypothetical protein|nr:hypothetical protein [Anaerolineae bacterium]